MSVTRDWFIETERGVEGPYSVPEIVALKAARDVADETRASRDRQAWRTVGEVLAQATPEELAAEPPAPGIFINCPRCTRGIIDRLETGQVVATVLVTLALALLVGAAGLFASRVLAWKIAHRQVLTFAAPGALGFLVAAALLVVGGAGAHFGFRLIRKWRAILRRACPYCEDGFIRRDEKGMLPTLVYFVRAFLVNEIILPVYETLTYQWLWRDRPRGDEAGGGRLATLARGVGFTFIIFGAVPFLWFLTGRDSVLGLGFALLVVGLIIRFIAVAGDEESPYRKGLLFLMIPLYYVSMVEVLRWCWVLSLGPGEMPPDASDLYLLGVDKLLLKTGIFFDVPDDLLGLQFFTGTVDSPLAVVALFVSRLLLDALVITAVARAFILAFQSARAFHRTGRKDVAWADVEALGSVEELAIRRDPRRVGEMEEGLREVTRVLLDAREYVRGVALAADPGSEIQAAATRSLELVESKDVARFGGSAGAETPADPPATRRTPLWEYGLAALTVVAWGILFGFFFGVAIRTATAREVAALLERARAADLAEDPIERRFLCERALRKAPDDLDALLLGAVADLDVAAQRIDLCDVERALIDIDHGFRKLIRHESLSGATGTDVRQALSARAYALRGRVFFIMDDVERAEAELRKERSTETRRLLFALALDRAAANLAAPDAPQVLARARAELGLDEGYAPAHLLEFGGALRALYEGDLDEAAGALAETLSGAGDFSPETRAEARRLRAAALARSGSRGRGGHPDAVPPLQAARAEIEALLAESPDDPEARLDLAWIHRCEGDEAEARREVDRVAAAGAAPAAVRDRARLWRVLLGLEEGGAAAAAARAEMLAFARERGADAFFLADLDAFLSGTLDAATLEARAARWRESAHHLQATLAALSVGLAAFAGGDPGAAAEALRRVVALVPPSEGDPAAAEGEMARGLLDLVAVLREGRVSDPRLFFHDARLRGSAALLRREVRLALFPPEQVARSLDRAMASPDPAERAQAVTAAAASGHLPAGRLLAALVAALADDDPSVRLAALDGMARLGLAAESALDPVTRALGDEDEGVRRAAIRVLATFGGGAAVPALTRALSDPDPYVRRDAAYALARRGEAAAAAQGDLVLRLDDPEVMVRDAAFAGLSALGAPGAEALAGVIGRTRDSYISIQAVRHLEASFPAVFARERERIVGFLIEVLRSDPDPASRRWAAQRLASLGRDERVADPAVLLQLSQQLARSLEESTDPAVAVGVAAAILRASRTYGIGSAAAVERYLAEIRDRQAFRETILASLLAPGIDVAALDVVEGLLDDEHLAEDGVRLLRSLIEQADDPGRLGEAAIERLRRRLRSDDEERASHAADALFALGETLEPETSAPLLADLLADPNDRCRSAALDVFALPDGWADDADLVARLRAGACAEDPGVRSVHLSLLVDVPFEDESLIAVLRAAAADPGADPGARAGALWAASRLPALASELAAAAAEVAIAGEDADVARGAVAVLLTALGPAGAAERLSAAGEGPTRTLLAVLPRWARGPAGAGQAQAVNGLLAVLLDREAPEVRMAAVRAIVERAAAGLRPPAESLAALRRLAAASDPSLARPARGLLVLADPAAASAADVADAVTSGDVRPAHAVLEALSALVAEGGAAAEQAALGLARGLGAADASVRDRAIELLAEAGVAGHAALRQALADPSADVRRGALLAMQRQGSEASPLAPLVEPLLASAEGPVARAAVEALGRVGWQAAAPAIRTLADHTPDAPLRATCWVALGRLGDPQSGREIERLLRRGEGEPRELAANLLEVDPALGVRCLTEALRERYGPLPAATAADLLGRQGRGAVLALPDLQTLTTDENPEVRRAATRAVERIRGS